MTQTPVPAGDIVPSDVADPTPGTLLPARGDAQLPAGARIGAGSHAATNPILSPRTGEPRRPWTVGAAAATGYITVAVLLYAFARIWAQSVTDVFHAARVIEWYRPAMSSWQAVFSPMLCAAICLLVAIPAAVGGHMGWNGWRRARWVGLAAAGLSPVTWLLTPWAMAAIIPAVATAVLLWLPASRVYALDQARHRAARDHMPRPAAHLDQPVIYGPVAGRRA